MKQHQDYQWRYIEDLSIHSLQWISPTWSFFSGGSGCQEAVSSAFLLHRPSSPWIPRFFYPVEELKPRLT